MELPAQIGAPGQITVNAAQTRLADLVVGQLYRVQITDTLPGKAEFLLGNQYLLAATQFQFQPGDVVNLKLVERTAELLTFQLTLPGGTTTPAEASSDMATLLRAIAAPDTAENRMALVTLMRAGVAVSPRSLGEVAQLINTVPPESIAAFLPLYKELVDKGLKPELAVLEQMARLSGSAPELAALLQESLDKARRRRGGRDKSKLLEDAIEAAITSLDDDHLPTAALLREKLRLLYGSPEKQLRDALQGITEEAPGRGKQPELHLELNDLANLAVGEDIPAELAVALNIVQALRITASLHQEATNLTLPVEIDGEPTEVHLSINVLAEQYYQKDYSLRLRVRNETQGRVEVLIRTRGPGLSIDVLSGDREVLEAYRASFEQLTAEINGDGGFFVRRVDAGAQSL